MQARNRLHDCEHEGCTKQTKARFCEEHLPRCTKCGTKCRKFEDPANAVCFNHSQYLRDKTREKVARYRARDREIKQQRKAALDELTTVVMPLVFEIRPEYLESIEQPGIYSPEEWLEFVAWMRINYHDVWLKYDMTRDASLVIDGLSGVELREYIDRMLNAFKDLDDAINN